MAENKPVRLDLSGFKPKSAAEIAAPPPEMERAAAEEGRRLGFVSRAEPVKIDGRTLRRKNKVQMNMRVSQEVREEFLLSAQAFEDANDFLAHLLQLHRGSRTA
ncbi:MAG: hypothetical protein ACRC67_40930 [Inquilinus sp.]|uniref:hypothetical protein n=1 Tax=Inquilinus sp. TaxID=1932117 RepID=UPI003F33E0BE